MNLRPRFLFRKNPKTTAEPPEQPNADDNDRSLSPFSFVSPPSSPHSTHDLPGEPSPPRSPTSVGPTDEGDRAFSEATTLLSRYWEYFHDYPEFQQLEERLRKLPPLSINQPGKLIKGSRKQIFSGLLRTSSEKYRNEAISLLRDIQATIDNLSAHPGPAVAHVPLPLAARSSSDPLPLGQVDVPQRDETGRQNSVRRHRTDTIQRGERPMMSISEAGRASPVLKPLPVVDEDKSASVSRDRRGAEYRPRRHEERRDREHDGERDKYYRERERERAKERSSENGEEKRRRSHNDVDRDKRYSHRHRSHRHDSRASLDEMSREAERDREKHDNGKWEMSRRERNRDRNRDGGGEKERKRERDRDQERERDEVDRDRDRDRDKDRDRERKRERNRERDRGRDRNGERRRGRDTDQVTSGEHGRDATDKERHQNSGEDRGVNQVHERGVEGERQDAGIDVEQVREDESSEGKGKGKKRDIEKQNNDEGKKTEHQPIMEHDHQRKKERERERHRERRRDGDGVGRYGGERYNDKYYDDKYGRTSRSFPEDYQKAERYQTHKRSYSHSGYSHGYYDRYRPREYDRYERYTNRDYRNDDRQQEGDKYERRRYHDKTRYEYEKYRNKGEQQTPHRTGDHEPSHTRRRSSEESIRMIPPPGWRAQQRQISEYRVRPDKPLPPASASQPQHVIPIFAGPPAPPTVIDYPTSVHRASMVVLPPTAPISHRTAADIGKTAGPGADIMPGMHWNPEVLRTRGQAAKAQGPRGEIAKQLINTEPAIVWNQASLAADAREQQKKSRFRRPPWLPTPKGHAGSRLLEVFSPQTATVQKQSLPLVRG